METFVIGVGGSGSGVGKTTAACLLLSGLKGWGAVKYTNTRLYSSLVDDPEVLATEGKDTRKLLDAGAREVLWVKSTRKGLKEPAQMAVQRLSHLEGVLVEGNGAIEVLKPDIVIFIKGLKPLKEGASRILDMAHVVLDAQSPAHEDPGGRTEGGSGPLVVPFDREGRYADTVLKYIHGCRDRGKT